MMLRMHNLYGTRPPTSEGSDEEEEDEEERKPQLELAMVPHYGGINRVRVCIVAGLLCSLEHAPNLPPPPPPCSYLSQHLLNPVNSYKSTQHVVLYVLSIVAVIIMH
jgi:hypothetical protein